MAIHRRHPRLPHAVPTGAVLLAMAPCPRRRRPLARGVRRLAHRPLAGRDGGGPSSPTGALAGPPRMAHAHHRLVVSGVVGAVRPARGLHAAVRRRVRHAAEPPLFRIPHQSARSRGHALARLQAVGRPGSGGVAADRLDRFPPAAHAPPRPSSGTWLDAPGGDRAVVRRALPRRARHLAASSAERVAGSLHQRRHGQHAAAELAL